MVGEVNSATIGIQGESDVNYVLLSYNNSYAENNLSANIFPAAEWLSVTPRTGIVPPGSNQLINVDIDTEGLLEGTYYDIISIQTNDYNNYLFDIPVVLNITDACGQWTTGDVNNDGDLNVQDVVLILNIALNSDNYEECQIFTSDLNGDGQINVQDIILLVNIILS